MVLAKNADVTHFGVNAKSLKCATCVTEGLAIVDSVDYHLTPLPGYWEIVFAKYNNDNYTRKFYHLLESEGFDLTWEQRRTNYNLKLVSHKKKSIMTIFCLRYSDTLALYDILVREYTPNTRGATMYQKRSLWN
jgi:hypothetical protein